MLQKSTPDFIEEYEEIASKGKEQQISQRSTEKARRKL